MSNDLYSLRKGLSIFGVHPDELITRGIHQKELPPFARSESDRRQLKSWTTNELPLLGEKVGFLKKGKKSIAVAVFVTKGGVLKSTLTLNIARLAALHNIRTCVVGLDMQGDITNALSDSNLCDEDGSLADALKKMNSLVGLPDVFAGRVSLVDVIRDTDIPTLKFIPETPELVALDQNLVHRNRREYWLKEQVIEPLKENFDLVLMDCSPNWNRLITNSLVACDSLISPLECKINNFRNLQMFRALIGEFRNDMRSSFKHIYVPTRIVPSRRLSQEIYTWYRQNLENCVSSGIRESLQGEESIALKISLPEYSPSSLVADEMRLLLQEIWQEMVNVRLDLISNRDKNEKASSAEGHL